MVLCLVVVVVVGYRCLMVLMRGWAVVVLRMIVPDVLVHVQRCPRTRGYGEGLKKHECDESAHEMSLLRRVRCTGQAAIRPQSGASESDAKASVDVGGPRGHETSQSPPVAPDVGDAPRRRLQDSKAARTESRHHRTQLLQRLTQNGFALRRSDVREHFATRSFGA